MTHVQLVAKTCIFFAINENSFRLGYLRARNPRLFINRLLCFMPLRRYFLAIFFKLDRKRFSSKGVWHEFWFLQYSRVFCYKTLIFSSKFTKVGFIWYFSTLISIFTKKVFSMMFHIGGIPGRRNDFFLKSRSRQKFHRFHFSIFFQNSKRRC